MIKRILPILFIAVLLLCSSCAKGDGVWGKYCTEKTDDGNYRSVEFAYSKTFYISDAVIYERERDGEENDALFEGWYSVDENTVTCTYTRTDKEDSGEKKTEKFTLTFTYDRERDVLTLDDGTVFTKETDT